MNCISSFGDSATAAIRDNPFSTAWTQVKRKSSLLSIFMMGDLCSAFMMCACMLVLHSCRVNTVNVCMCVCVCVSIEDLLGSKAGMLILHGLSKWADRSHYSHYRMRRAVVPSAWIHMSGQTDLSFALSVPKRLWRWTQTCIVHLWEHGPVVCLKAQWSIQKNIVTCGLLLLS